MNVYFHPFIVLTTLIIQLEPSTGCAMLNAKRMVKQRFGDYTETSEEGSLTEESSSSWVSSDSSSFWSSWTESMGSRNPWNPRSWNPWGPWNPRNPWVGWSSWDAELSSWAAGQLGGESVDKTRWDSHVQILDNGFANFLCVTILLKWRYSGVPTTYQSWVCT